MTPARVRALVTDASTEDLHHLVVAATMVLRQRHGTYLGAPSVVPLRIAELDDLLTDLPHQLGVDRVHALERLAEMLDHADAAKMLRRHRRMLRVYQWSGAVAGGERTCGMCGMRESVGHGSGCELADAMRWLG